MDFVDHEHLIAIASGCNREVADDDVADVVDTGVGRGVDLEDVEVAALGDLDACRISPDSRSSRSFTR